MTGTHAQLVARKLDLLVALRQLEQDHRDGLVDGAAYIAARRRYEEEAATILERLDAAVDQQNHDASGRRPILVSGRRSPLVIAFAAAVVVAAIAIFLVTALHPRSIGQTVTGDVPGAVPTPAGPPSPRLLAAEHEVRKRPRSIDALLSLGNAYADDHDPAAADGAYREAMRLDPARPEPPTFHAMMFGVAGRYTQGLALLQRVERSHPGYSRAWLLDGLLSYDNRQYARAIVAWRRFLVLNPGGAVASTTRRLIATARKAEGPGKRP